MHSICIYKYWREKKNILRDDIIRALHKLTFFNKSFIQANNHQVSLRIFKILSLNDTRGPV